MVGLKEYGDIPPPFFADGEGMRRYSKFQMSSQEQQFKMFSTM